MADPIRREGFLVLRELTTGQFHSTLAEAESAAKAMLPSAGPPIDEVPIFVVPATQFTTEEMEQFHSRPGNTGGGSIPGISPPVYGAIEY